jgi:hypothetical protein
MDQVLEEALLGAVLPPVLHSPEELAASSDEAVRH